MAAYSPQSVTINVNGFLLTGFAPDTFVTVTQDSTDGAAVRGADGLIAYAIDKALPQATMNASLMQTSAGNNIMASLLALQKSTGQPLTASLFVAGSLESVTWSSCVIEKAPDIGLSQSIESREWTITGQALVRPGGSIIP